MPKGVKRQKGAFKRILKDGCRTGIVLWGDILIDGHNRYEICTRQNIPFNTVQMDFSSRDDVVIWIIKNQFGRRNLPAYERAKLALRLKPVIAEKAKEQQLSTLKQGNTVPQISAKRGTPIETREELAKVAGVSHDTIAKVEKIEQKATPEIKTQLQTGEISINQAYKTVKKEENRQKRQGS